MSQTNQNIKILPRGVKHPYHVVPPQFHPPVYSPVGPACPPAPPQQIVVVNKDDCECKGLVDYNQTIYLNTLSTLISNIIGPDGAIASGITSQVTTTVSSAFEPKFDEITTSLNNLSASVDEDFTNLRNEITGFLAMEF